jgi:hypothetical protein
MKDFIVHVSSKTSKAEPEIRTLAVDGENLMGNIIFDFVDEFVDGVARLEWEREDGVKDTRNMTKVGETYVLPIKSAITNEGKIIFQIVIDKVAVNEEIPIFKSEEIYAYVKNSIRAEGEQPEEFPTWMDVGNEKIAEMDNLNIEVNKVDNVTTVTLTDKQGEPHETEIYDGKDGKDAKINGENTISIEAGTNISIEQEDGVLTINNTYDDSSILDDIENLKNGKQDKIDGNHKLSADLVDDTNTINKFTSSDEKSTWNAKYNKPNSGIPKSDLASDVQTSLGKADTAVQKDVNDLTNYTTTEDMNAELSRLLENVIVFEE